MKLPPETEQLLLAYFAGDTSDETIKAMEAWLREDKANPRILAEYGLVDRLIAHEQKKLDTSAIFALLLEAEEAAEPIVVTLPKKNEQTKQARAKRPHEPLKYKEAFLGLQSLAFDTLRHKAGTITGVAAVAAIALLALALFNPWADSDNPDAQPFTDNTPTELNNPAATTESTPRGSATVATLTAEHNAVWAEGASAPGSPLRAGQRLTLTAGFAEITTNDGAIAILQAPATIELTDHDNAIRLHTGKLVGICETESSKGFLVRTPHMDITDLGTRFGIDADADATEVHVFEGEVEAHRPDASTDTQPMRFVANQSARTSADTDTITRIDHDTDRFAAVNHDGSLNRSVLLARTDAGLDIIDIIAGGDGRGAARMRGIHPQTGEQNAEPILDYSASFLDSHGGYTPVRANPFIDGIFIPHTTEEVQVDSSGRTVSGLDVSTPRSFQLLWAGGLMPFAGSQDVVEGVARMYPEQPQQAPVLYFISNKGVTLDLDSLREHHGVRGTLTFRTLVQSIASLENSRSGTADFLCLVDGNEVAEIRDMKQGSDPTPITFRIEPTRRFLTLIVTDSGDQLHMDWVVLDRPVLEPEAAN